MYISKISYFFITICIILLFNSYGTARSIIQHPSLSKFSFRSGGHIYTGEDIANLFDAHNATGDSFSKYGIQRALFFKDDNSDMYVAAIHEETDTLLVYKINIENMARLNEAIGSGADQKMIAKLKEEDPAFGLVFQPTTNLARSRSYGGFAEEVVDRDFPALSQLYNDYRKEIMQIKKANEEENRNTSNSLATKEAEEIVRKCHWKFEIISVEEYELASVICAASNYAELVPGEIRFVLLPRSGWLISTNFYVENTNQGWEYSRKYEMHHKNKIIRGELQASIGEKKGSVIFQDKGRFFKTSEIQEIISSDLKLIISGNHPTKRNYIKTTRWISADASKVMEILEDLRKKVNVDFNR